MLKKIGYLCLLALCIFTITSCKKDTDEEKKKEVCNVHIDINLDNKCDNCGTTLEEIKDDRVLKTLMFKENLYEENYERIIIIDFENNNVMRKKGKVNTTSYQNLEFNQIATFTDAQEQEIINVIKQSNLLHIDSEYNKKLDTPVEGWELEIKFTNNTEMKSSGQDEIPLEPFLTCAIPLYKLCNETVIRFWPKTLTVARIEELFDRCNYMVDQNKLENGADAVLTDSKGNEISYLGYGFDIHKPNITDEARTLYNLVIESIYRKDLFKTFTSASGKKYTEDEVSNHLINPDCHDYVLDANGNIKYDEKGIAIKQYRTCSICRNVSYSITKTNGIYQTSSREKKLYIMLYEWCNYDCLSDLFIDGYYA